MRLHGPDFIVPLVRVVSWKALSSLVALVVNEEGYCTVGNPTMWRRYQQKFYSRQGITAWRALISQIALKYWASVPDQRWTACPQTQAVFCPILNWTALKKSTTVLLVILSSRKRTVFRVSWVQREKQISKQIDKSF